MEACTYFNTAAASLLFAFISAGACGGSSPPPAAPPPPPTAGETSTYPDPSPVPPEPVGAAATTTPSPTPAAPTTAASSATDGPDRSLNDIRAIVANNRDTFRACYDKAAKAHPGIKGTFTVKFVVNPDGTVKSAEADSTKSDIHAPELDTCAIAALKTLKFPPSKRGMESAVNYPFEFKPQSGKTTP
jgi:TonB family protein